MPLPVNTDTFLTRLIWRSTGAPRPASNNLYWFDSVGGQSEANLNTDINAAVTANMWLAVLTGAAVTDVIVTPLDGVTAGSNFATGSPAKWTGAGGTDPILQGAVVVSAKTSVRGPAGRGRIYLPWVAELQQTAGTLVPANVTTMQTAWTTFLGAMATSGWLAALPDPNGATSHLVNQYVVRPYLKTQRRRALR